MSADFRKLARIAELAARLTHTEMQTFGTCAIGEGRRAGLIKDGGLHADGYNDAARSLNITRELAVDIFCSVNSWPRSGRDVVRAIRETMHKEAMG